MFGKTTNSEGASLDNTIAPVITGLKVPGNEIVSLEMGKDKDGNATDAWAVLTVKQNNGAELRHTIWAPKDEDKSRDRLNAFILHLCLAFVTTEEYTSLVGSPTSFSEFINNVNTNIIPKSKDQKFTMTIIREQSNSNGKWYAKLPSFPAFIEKDGTNPSTLFMKKSYIFDIPETTDMTSAPATAKQEGDLF